jgi:hypothetical protein
MAKLQVSPEMLAQCLFQDASPGVEIVGASFDHQRGIVLLEIAGHGVPDTEFVTAILTKKWLDVKFEPAAK